MTVEKSISSAQHPLIKHLVKLRTDASYRNDQRLLVLDGLKPIQEVSHLLTKVLFTPSYAASAAALPGEKWEITEPLLKKVSGMTTPEGIFAEIRMPPFVQLDKQKLVLALDGISDPGNLGTLLRTALALGWNSVYFLPGCCDPYNEKALRAARGAHFKLDLAKGSTKNLQEWAVKRNVQALVADGRGKHPETILKHSERLLVLGNEAHGASEDIRLFCHSVAIPMPGDMESLNVAIAGGILLYLFST